MKNSKTKNQLNNNRGNLLLNYSENTVHLTKYLAREHLSTVSPRYVGDGRNYGFGKTRELIMRNNTENVLAEDTLFRKTSQ